MEFCVTGFMVSGLRLSGDVYLEGLASSQGSM